MRLLRTQRNDAIRNQAYLFHLQDKSRTSEENWKLAERKAVAQEFKEMMTARCIVVKKKPTAFDCFVGMVMLCQLVAFLPCMFFDIPRWQDLGILFAGSSVLLMLISLMQVD